MSPDADGASGLLLHHLGVACRDLDRETAAFEALGYRREGDDFEDHVQGVSGRFIIGPGPRLELLVDLPGSSAVEPWLGLGSCTYHHAYTTPDLQLSLERLLVQRARLVVAPVPAAAFAGRLICFVMLRNLQLVELIEAPVSTSVNPSP